MRTPKYKFLVSDGSTTKQVAAHYKELKKSFSKENLQQFFRVSLEGTITVFKDDFDFINSKSINTEFTFTIINVSASGRETTYFEGKFTKIDCKFDYSRKKCEIKVEATDQYDNVLNKYSNTYDLLKLETPPAITSINMYKRPIVQVYIKGSSTISNFLSNTYWENEVSSVVDNENDLINKYHFNRVRRYNEIILNAAGVNETFAGADGVYESENYKMIFDVEYPIGSSYPYISNPIANIRNIDESRRANIDNNELLTENVYSLTIYNKSTGKDVGGIATRFFDSEPKGTELYIGADSLSGVINGNVFNNVPVILDTVFERLLCDIPSATTGATIFEVPYDDFVGDNSNYKYCAAANCGTIHVSINTQDEPTVFGINDYGKYFTNKFISVTAAQGRPMPVCRNFWGNASVWYIKNSMYETLIDQVYRKLFTVRDTYNIADVIKALLKEIDPTLKHEATEEYSRFLYSTKVPLPNMQKFYVFLSQKSNILKGEYDQPAQKAEISFESLMNMLRDCFKCYWFIEDGKFKIEHIRYFLLGRSYTSTPTTSYDLTTKTDEFNKKQVLYAQSEISYDKSELSARYEFSWADESTESFSGQNINVNSVYVQKDKTEDISISDFSSDVDYMLLNPSNFSEDGFALLCPILYNGMYTLPIINDSTMVDPSGIRYESFIQNYYASWRNLLRFYMYDLSGSDISIDTIIPNTLYVYSVKKCMKQDVEFTPVSNIDEFDIIKTDIGDGSIDSFKVDIDTKLTEVTLVYHPK